MTGSELRFSGLVRAFGHLRVLDGVDGAVGPGGLLHVTGRNGSGKSTLLRCLAGLVAPQRGTIHLTQGDRVLDLEERRRAVGYLAPDLELYPELTTGENLRFFARLRGVDEERGAALLARVDLPAGRTTATLSSGMRQRLRLAFALLHRPALLLLDEPLQNLDAPGRRAVRDLLAEHLAAGGMAVVANPELLELGDLGDERVTRLSLDG